MKVGDRIAIKARENLPFDTGGGDRDRDAPQSTRDHRFKSRRSRLSRSGMARFFRSATPLVFFTKRNAVWQLRDAWEHTPALIRSIFEGEPQDYEFLAKRFSEFWPLPDEQPTDPQGEIETAKPYSVEDLTADGVFP
jgi:hypothetical protein